MYEDHAALGIPPERIFPVGGLYQEGTTRYPMQEEVRDFVRRATARGSRGVSYWSYEHISEEMWQAVASAAIGVEEEEEMSSPEFQQVGDWISALAGRLSRLEAQVGALVAAPGAPPSSTYTVQPGDTLSGIAASFGLDGWQPLYDANRRRHWRRSEPHLSRAGAGDAVTAARRGCSAHPTSASGRAGEASVALRGCPAIVRNTEHPPIISLSMHITEAAPRL